MTEDLHLAAGSRYVSIRRQSGRSGLSFIVCHPSRFLHYLCSFPNAHYGGRAQTRTQNLPPYYNPLVGSSDDGTSLSLTMDSVSRVINQSSSASVSFRSGRLWLPFDCSSASPKQAYFLGRSIQSHSGTLDVRDCFTSSVNWVLTQSR